MDKRSIKELHREAMELADTAYEARRLGNLNQAQQRFFIALDLERQAARKTAEIKDSEPSRSILFRSAATLALHAGKFSEGMRLVEEAFKGSPPADIAKELEAIDERLRSAITQQKNKRPIHTRGKKAFAPGEEITESGIYRASHNAHRLMHDVTLLRGQKFPRCKECGDAIRFELVRPLAEEKLLKINSVDEGFRRDDLDDFDVKPMRYI